MPSLRVLPPHGSRLVQPMLALLALVALLLFAAPALGGAGIWDYVTETALPDYSIAGQVWIQAQGVLTTIVVSGVVALVAFTLIKATIGLRVPEEAEREGLDIASHGESAYS